MEAAEAPKLELNGPAPDFEANTTHGQIRLSEWNKDRWVAAVGKEIAERAKQAGVESVAFDRSGFKYHGRVKALADAAREAGLKF